MSRQTKTTVTCDYKDCNSKEDGEKDVYLTPKGWYEIEFYHPLFGDGKDLQELIFCKGHGEYVQKVLAGLISVRDEEMMSG
jgi:hypothetical protein